MAPRPPRLAELPNDLRARRQGRLQQHRAAKVADTPITVTDDLPDVVPVTDHEARIIEAFFADVLDELFGRIP